MQPIARQSIFVRYWLFITLLVGSVILLVSLVNGYFVYRGSFKSISAIQQAETRSAALRIDEYLRNIESQIREVASLPWASGTLAAAERENEYFRLLKIQPALRDIRVVDPVGRELLFVSRLEQNRVSSEDSAKFAPDKESVEPENFAYSPIFFRDGTEPLVTLSLREGKDTSSPVMLVDMNVRFVSEVVASIKIGTTGQAYVVDSSNRLVAHPNPSLALRRLDMSSSPTLDQARLALAAGATGQLPTSWSTGFSGQASLASMVYVPRARWIVVVEQTASEVLEPIKETVLQALVILALGLVASFIASSMLARSLARPIVEVQHGAQRIGKGDLSARIDIHTNDELESLAREFNDMAERLSESYSGLEQKVAQKTAQIERANRHKSEFLANISHELRTPLNAVIGFSDVLKDQYFGALNGRQQRYVRDIQESGQHMLSLINDLLDLSKIEAGRMDLELSRLNLADAIEDSLVLVRERAIRKSLKLNCSIGEGVGKVVADERKLKQILINLLANAVKFSHPDGWVEIAAVRGTNETLITVRDTGIGIAKADQATIFEEFRQVKSSIDARGEGTGLGLSLARRFVELHGGRIWVESESGQGAAFTISLPDGELPPPAAA